MTTDSRTGTIRFGVRATARHCLPPSARSNAKSDESPVVFGGTAADPVSLVTFRRGLQSLIRGRSVPITPYYIVRKIGYTVLYSDAEYQGEKSMSP
jgi:hypothetical protein